MSTESADFLFVGSHPAFCWAALLLHQKGKKVVMIPHPNAHHWECVPSEVVDVLNLQSFKVDRNDNPIQILTPKKRVGIFANRESTQKDFKACVDSASSPEVIRGYTYYAKGSDFPTGIGEEISALMDGCQSMEYFDFKGTEIQKSALDYLKKEGILFREDERNVTAEQTLKLDLDSSKIFRWKFEIVLPINKTHPLPVGATTRMLYVERNAPILEIIQQGGLRVRALILDEPILLEKESQEVLISRMIQALKLNFPESHWKVEEAVVSPRSVEQLEFHPSKKPVDTSEHGVWKFSLALNPVLGERTLLIRISEMLTQKFKKQPLFDEKELFSVAMR